MQEDLITFMFFLLNGIASFAFLIIPLFPLAIINCINKKPVVSLIFNISAIFSLFYIVALIFYPGAGFSFIVSSTCLIVILFILYFDKVNNKLTSRHPFVQVRRNREDFNTSIMTVGIRRIQYDLSELQNKSYIKISGIILTAVACLSLWFDPNADKFIKITIFAIPELLMIISIKEFLSQLKTKIFQNDTVLIDKDKDSLLHFSKINVFRFCKYIFFVFFCIVWIIDILIMLMIKYGE